MQFDEELTRCCDIKKQIQTHPTSVYNRYKDEITDKETALNNKVKIYEKELRHLTKELRLLKAEFVEFLNEQKVVEDVKEKTIEDLKRFYNGEDGSKIIISFYKANDQ